MMRRRKKAPRESARFQAPFSRRRYLKAPFYVAIYWRFPASAF